MILCQVRNTVELDANQPGVENQPLNFWAVLQQPKTQVSRAKAS